MIEGSLYVFRADHTSDRLHLGRPEPDAQLPFAFQPGKNQLEAE